MLLKVLIGFWDLREHRQRNIGDEFEVTEERATEIMGIIPGYVEAVEPPAVGLEAMTVAELRSLAKERGIQLPKNATKTKLVELIGG